MFCLCLSWWLCVCPVSSMPRRARVAESGGEQSGASQPAIASRAAGTSERFWMRDCVVQVCTAAKNVEECGMERASVVVMCWQMAYRRVESWLLLVRVGRSDRHQRVAAVAVLAGKGRNRRAHDDVAVWGRVTESGQYPATHRQRICAISSPVALHFYHSFTWSSPQHYSRFLFVTSRTRQLYIGQRRARFTLAKEKRHPPTKQQVRCETAALPRTVKIPV
jgi:hypothetical protein